MSECTRPILTKFSGVVDLWVKMIDPPFSDRSRDVAMATHFWTESAKLANPPSLIVGYWHSNKKPS